MVTTLHQKQINSCSVTSRLDGLLDGPLDHQLFSTSMRSLEAARRSYAAALVTATSRVPATAARNSLSGKAEKGSVFELGFLGSSDYNKIAMNSSIKEGHVGSIHDIRRLNKSKTIHEATKSALHRRTNGRGLSWVIKVFLICSVYALSLVAEAWGSKRNAAAQCAIVCSGSISSGSI